MNAHEATRRVARFVVAVGRFRDEGPFTCENNERRSVSRPSTPKVGSVFVLVRAQGPRPAHHAARTAVRDDRPPPTTSERGAARSPPPPPPPPQRSSAPARLPERRGTLATQRQRGRWGGMGERRRSERGRDEAADTDATKKKRCGSSGSSRNGCSSGGRVATVARRGVESERLLVGVEDVVVARPVEQRDRRLAAVRERELREVLARAERPAVKVPAPSSSPSSSP